MKRSASIPAFALLALLLSSCSTTFGGTVLVLNFRDIILYIFIAIVIAGLIAFINRENKQRHFIIWFIVSLLLTPLPGLIWFLYKATKKKDRE